MKFKKLITLASLVGLITFLLPVVLSGNQFIPPLSEHVSEYLDAPLWYLFLIWYGAFVITFLLSLVIGKGRVLQIITSIIVILVSLFGIFCSFFNNKRIGWKIGFRFWSDSILCLCFDKYFCSNNGHKR